MNIEEFDKKKPLLKIVNDLDDIISELNSDDGQKGIGVVTRQSLICNPIYFTTSDSILIGRFKQLLLERKQELINEFEKE